MDELLLMLFEIEVIDVGPLSDVTLEVTFFNGLTADDRRNPPVAEDILPVGFVRPSFDARAKEALSVPIEFLRFLVGSKLDNSRVESSIPRLDARKLIVD